MAKFAVSKTTAGRANLTKGAISSMASKNTQTNDLSETLDEITLIELSKFNKENKGKLQVQVSHPDKPVSACCN